MQRRLRGTGSVEAMPDGRFRGRLPGNGKRLEPCWTEEEAHRALDAALAKLAAEVLVPVGGDTVAGFGLEVLDVREGHGIRGVATERSRWRTHLEESPLGRSPLKRLTRADVVTWRDGMLAKRAAPGKGQRQTDRRLSRTTVQNTMNLLRAVLDRAVDGELLKSNPAKDVRLPRGAGRTHDPWTYLLPAEQEALLRCPAIAEPDRLLVAFALGTGMRQGEVWNLELVDVHRDHVVVRYGGANHAPTKSGKIRRVPLFGIARAALDRWLELLPAQPNAAKLAWPLPGGTRRQKGEPSWWARALERAGIVAADRHDGRAVRWHDLRHSCASSLVAGWWSRKWRLEEVQALLGHGSITTTERYAHLAESTLTAAALATFGETMGRSSPASSAAAAPNLADLLSHLRDLNSRPTVYEGVALPLSDPALGSLRGEIVGLSRRAVDVLEAITAGDPHSLARAQEVLVDLVVLADRDEQPAKGRVA